MLEIWRLKINIRAIFKYFKTFASMKKLISVEMESDPDIYYINNQQSQAIWGRSFKIVNAKDPQYDARHPLYKI